MVGESEAAREIFEVNSQGAFFVFDAERMEALQVPCV